MMLDVAHIVQKEFPDTNVNPFERAALTGLLVSQSVNRCPALRAAMIEIGLELALRIGPLWKQPCRIQLIQRERSRWSESFQGIGLVEVEPEERVIGHVPKLRPPRAVVPQIV